MLPRICNFFFFFLKSQYYRNIFWDVCLQEPNMKLKGIILGVDRSNKTLFALILKVSEVNCSYN